MSAPKKNKRPISSFPATKPAKSGKKAADDPNAPPPRMFPVGYFTPTWPPGFVSALTCRKGHLQELNGRDMGQQNRAEGRGWGDGTIAMPRTPERLAPGTMRKSRSSA